MDITQYAVATTAIIGLINGVQLALNKNWVSFGYFLAAVIAGTVFGFLQWFSLPSIEIGFLVGIASSGVYKSFQVLRGVK